VPTKKKIPADWPGSSEFSCLSWLRGVTRDQAAQSNTAPEQQQAATHDQCDIEPGERQEATLIGVAGLRSCGVAAATGTRDTRGTTALCNLSRCPASLTAVTGTR
jgi:hypothetical protein